MIKLQIEGPIGTIILARPESRNALSPALTEALAEALGTLQSDPDVRAIVLRAEGPAFCAGADLQWLGAPSTPEHSEHDIRQLADVFRTLYQCPKPTIARVQGAAYGGGIGLVAACDLSVAASAATFCFSEVRLGLIPAIISPYVVRRMAPATLRRYLLTAERFSAADACAAGLLTTVADDEDGLDTVIAGWIEHLLKAGPGALAEAKRLQDLAAQPLTEEIVVELAHCLAARRLSDEGQEGIQAFLQRRPPSWSGS